VIENLTAVFTQSGPETAIRSMACHIHYNLHIDKLTEGQCQHYYQAVFLWLHIGCTGNKKGPSISAKSLIYMALPERFERPAF